MGRFVTNRSDVENGIRQGGWVVAFSQRELTETDALGALIATAAAIYTDQPEIIFGYLDAIIDQSIEGLEAAIQQTVTAEVQSQIKNFAIPLIKHLLNGRSSGEAHETLGSFGVKAGLAKFIGHNEEWNPVANPGGILGGDTGAWQQVGPGLVSYCPYVGIRYLQTSPSGGGSVSHIFVTFKNHTSYNVAFYLNGGSGLKTKLDAGKSQSFNMVVNPGIQPIVGVYQVDGQRLDFTVSNNGNYAFIMQNGRIVNSFA